jgi:hypothetical protein
MNIDLVATATKVGTFVINNNPKTKATLKVEWEDLDKSILQNDSGRVYLLVVDNVIRKIGGSVSKGGIKATMSFYASGNCGRPSIRSYGICVLIENELKSGKNVEIYMIQSEQVKAPVNGLFGTTQSMVSAFKEMETQCVADYVKIEGQHPDWNYQEAGKPWEQYIQEGHAKLLS